MTPEQKKFIEEVKESDKNGATRPIRQKLLQIIEEQEGVIEKGKKDLKDLIDIQSSNGNWNYDPYMHGMANGLICALATINGEEANYLSAPKEWLKDKIITSQSALLNEYEDKIKEKDLLIEKMRKVERDYRDARVIQKRA